MIQQPSNGDAEKILDQQLTLDFDHDEFVSSTSAAGSKWRETAIRIAERKEKTRDTISLILVIAFVCAFPVYVIALGYASEIKQEVMTGFTQWLAVMGSLTGAAVGVRAMAQNNK